MNAFLHIQTALRNNKTFLKKAYHTTPFKIANITENKNDHGLKLMLMSSSPGILDGDEYQLKIELEEGCSLELQTQSYQRLFNMKKGASQNVEVHMGAGSSFCYLPHPSVPHKAADFVATNKIYLSGGCKLIWGEVLTCGRKLSGEAFQFTGYQNRTEIFLNERLVVKENLLIKPHIVNVNAIGQFEGYSHQASFIYIDEAADINELIPEIIEMLSVHENICFGVSALPVNGIVVRLLGYKGEQLYNCLQLIARLLTAKEVV
ncbi:MAG: urease accessory protein UreD [Segetibacter sp.]|nr:urease accessory protein UreD [Segetibacter sp.]